MSLFVIIILLWIGIFLVDVLDSFTPPPNYVIVNNNNNKNKPSSSAIFDHRVIIESKNNNNNITITLPRFLSATAENLEEEDNDDLVDLYPSPLHKIHIRTLLNQEESQKCFNIAVQYAELTGRWDQPDYDRHVSYATCDFAVEDCMELEQYLHSINFDHKLFEQLSYLYDIDPTDMSYLDLFVAHYQAKNNNNNNNDNDKEDDDDNDENNKNNNDNNTMDRLEAHRDGTILAFSLLLNPPNDFTGGGTFYDALRDVVVVEDDDNDNNNDDQKQSSSFNEDYDGVLHPGGVIRPKKEGQAVLHCGKVLHGADVVTSGSRTVLVGFIDVADHCIRPGALTEACTDFGRMDVANYRYKRQLSKEGNNNKVGWTISNDRWLKGQHSYISGCFVPAFASVRRRADPEYQRRQKLITEDRLLRRILLPRNERQQADIGIFDDGDITIIS